MVYGRKRFMVEDLLFRGKIILSRGLIMRDMTNFSQIESSNHE